VTIERKIITSSLEGMRVIIGEQCELQEYNFSVNQWFPKDEAAWPLSRALADEWLAGWNDVDRFAAVNRLTAPDEYPDKPLRRSFRNLPDQPQPK
jgi:hypothetical protein